MQALRQLARRLNNPKFARRVLPPLQQTRQEAKDAKIVLQQLLDDHVSWLKQRNEIKDLFEELDVNGDGKLDMEELAQALRKGRIPTSHQHMIQLYQEIDNDSNGMIDLDDFTTFVIYRKQKLQQAFEWIMQHNTSSDEQKRGFTAETFRTAAAKSGVNLSDADINKIMQHLDQNGNKHISYDEFVNCMLFAPDINPRCFLDSWYTEAFCDDAASEYTIPREIRTPSDLPFSVVVSKKLSCGGAAGCLSRTFTAPIERVRVLMMTSAERLGIGSAVARATNGGFTRLWMGNGVNCLKITPEMGIKLVSFDIIKNRIAQDSTNASISEQFHRWWSSRCNRSSVCLSDGGGKDTVGHSSSWPNHRNGWMCPTDLGTRWLSRLLCWYRAVHCGHYSVCCDRSCLEQPLEGSSRGIPTKIKTRD